MSRLRTLTDVELSAYLRFADLALPRHTSYPAANFWTRQWGSADSAENLRVSLASGEQHSLYVHVPFCRSLCLYCACTREIVAEDRRAAAATEYLDALRAEIRAVRGITGPLVLSGVHLGGGTPTYLSPGELMRLWELIRGAFIIAPEAELAVEVDPRVTSAAHLESLRRLGFDRISLGVQDFAPKVQKAVGRIQSLKTVTECHQNARALGFSSINFDLIYGLPFQTISSIEQTLDEVIALRPDRIAFFRFALMPDLFRWQRSFTPMDLPNSRNCLDFILAAWSKFEAAGYEMIGFDHFALPHDRLVTARREGSIGRSFQGMGTGREQGVIGIGPSAISGLSGSFSQNESDIKRWQQLAHESGLAATRGHRLDGDDLIRQNSLQDWYGNGRVVWNEFDKRHNISSQTFFAGEIKKLEVLKNQGLITLDVNGFTVKEPLGRLLMRVVGAAFDAYLPADAYLAGVASGQASQTG